jgi:hypothetical protein
LAWQTLYSITQAVPGQPDDINTEVPASIKPCNVGGNATMTSKHRYFEEFKDLESSEIFITSGISDLKQEIESNCIYLPYPETLSDIADPNEFLEFLNRIKDNRRLQLIQSGKSIELIYYSWFDAQAGQFRFTFINSDHENLPFGCSIVFVAEEMEIIEKFLSFFRKVDIPWSELEDVNEDAILTKEADEFFLSVYTTKINVNKI